MSRIAVFPQIKAATVQIFLPSLVLPFAMERLGDQYKSLLVRKGQGQVQFTSEWEDLQLM